MSIVKLYDGCRKFDFDADPAWKAVEARLEIPPGKEAVLVYRRAKWYNDNIVSPPLL